MPKKSNLNHIGIDVSKKYLDVFIRPTMEAYRVTNDLAGFKELKKRLPSLKQSLAAVEATGGYESEVVEFLQEKGCPVAVTNPRQVRNFGKALGKLAKTDKIDASIIAHFAEVIKPAPKEKVSENEKMLVERQQRRRQLVDMLTMEKNRLAKAKGSVKTGIKKSIEFLEKQLKELEKELEQQISEHEEWSENRKLLCTVKGVKSITATALIAGLPELGKVSHKEIAALVGVAPLNRDSGNYQGERCIWGGRADVRSALYMATLVAVQFNTRLKNYYQKLCAKGKKKKVALVACMHKLLTILNAMIKNRVAWDTKLIETATINA